MSISTTLSEEKLIRLGRFFKHVRVVRGRESETPSLYSQEMVSLRIKCYHRTLSKFENGKYEPKISLFIALCNIYELDLEKIMRLMKYLIGDKLDD